MSKRRGQGEDSIYCDAAKNRYVGAVSLGFSPAGMRICKKVTGRTKNEVRDKLRVPEKGGRLAVPCGRASPGIAVPKLRRLGAGPGRRQSESSD